MRTGRSASRLAAALAVALVYCPLSSLATTFGDAQLQAIESAAHYSIIYPSRSAADSRARNLEAPVTTAAAAQVPDTSGQAQEICASDIELFRRPVACLIQKPFASIGLPAFRESAITKKRGVLGRDDCAFTLSSGLFKGFEVSKTAFRSDGKCVDSARARIMVLFRNVTLAYLWDLRCTDKSDLIVNELPPDFYQPKACVGSSQTRGHTWLKLSDLEAEFDFTADIFGNWRLTNETVKVVPPNTSKLFPTSNVGKRAFDDNQSASTPSLIATTNLNKVLESMWPETHLREFGFELLDGEATVGHHLDGYKEWTRNKMHRNFVEQFRRFLWATIQRCLADSNQQPLPNKLADLFANKFY